MPIARRLLNILTFEVREWFEFFIRFVPGRVGLFIRRTWYKRLFCQCNRLQIGVGCQFVAPNAMTFTGLTLIGDHCYFNADGGTISIGNWTAFNRGAHINAACGGKIVIGEHCPIGPGVVMRTANHKFSRTDLYIQDQGHEPADIIIDDDVWIGANAIILGGVHIGKGAVIGAGAVVANNIPPMGIAVGVPARVIRYRGQSSVEK